MDYEDYDEALLIESFYDDENSIGVIDESELYGESNLSAEHIETINTINRAVEGMSPSEAEQYMSEFFPALIPLLTSALPSLLPLVPTATKAIGSLFQNGFGGILGGTPSGNAAGSAASGGSTLGASASAGVLGGLGGILSGIGGTIGQPPTPIPHPRTPPRVPQPRIVHPVPRPVPPTPVTPAPPSPIPFPYPTGISPVSPQLSEFLNRLLALLRNSNILDMLSNLVAGMGQTSATTNNGIVVPAADILGAISNLAGAGASAIAQQGPGFGNSENFGFDEGIDDEKAEAIANLFI